MKKKIFLKTGGLLLPVILIAGFLISDFAFAYDHKNAHPALTFETAEFFNSISEKKISEEETNWMMQGADEEDTPPRWINHFYNSETREGWSAEKLGSVDPKFLSWFSSFTLSGRKPVSAKNWAKNRSAQADYSLYLGDNTWQRAIELYALGDKKGAFTALGHTLHLLQDMTVPDHTRGDTHAGLAGDKGSSYENFAEQQTRGKIKSLNIAEELKKSGIRALDLPILDNYFEANAKYSHNNFFSDDTINDGINLKIFYKKDNGIDVISFVKNGNDLYPVVKNPRDDKSKDDYTLNDPLILSAYWERLSKQAVVSGAGVINLFFKEVEEYKKLHPKITEEQISFSNKKRVGVISPFGELVKINNKIVQVITGTQKFVGSFLPQAGKTTVVKMDEISDSKDEPQPEPEKEEAPPPLIVQPKPAKQSEATNKPAPKEPEKIADKKSEQKQEPKEKNVYVSHIVDGDTVTLSNGKDVRLIGIDTPEAGEECFEEAKNKLSELVLAKNIRLEKDQSETDKYGRLLRFIYLENNLVNAEMLRGGFAKVMSIPPDTKYYGAFKNLQAEAKFFKRGCLWEQKEVGGAPEDDIVLPAEKNDKGPYYGGASWAGSPGVITEENPIPLPQNSSSEPPVEPENQTATSTPESSPITPTSTPQAATSTPSESEDPEPEPEPEPEIKILINEVQTAGETPEDEFIEFYNPNQTPINLADWKLTKKTKSGNESNLISKFPKSSIIPGQSYFLITPQGGAPADTNYSGSSYSVAADNAIILKNQNGQVVDKIGFGEASDYENQPFLNPPAGQSLNRINFQDTDNNSLDFTIASSTPQASSSTPAALPQPEPQPEPQIFACDYPQYDANHKNNIGEVDYSKVAFLPDLSNTLSATISPNPDGKPYYVISTYTIPKNRRVIIEAGTVIKFGRWRQGPAYELPAKMIVQGSLEINGTKNNPVIFTTFYDNEHGTAINSTTSTPAPDDWGALQIESDEKETVKIQNAEFYYGGGSRGDGNDPGGAIFINNAKAQIEISDSLISKSHSGIYSRGIGSSRPDIFNNQVEYNNLWGAVLKNNGTANISGNIFRCNGNDHANKPSGGVWVSENNEKIKIENNNFFTNNNFGLFFSPQGANNFSAVNNFWGHGSGPRHSSNASGEGDAVSDNVDFSPWLSASSSF